MLLEMKNVTKTFPGVKALDNVNLSLDKGEILALVGENGAGKSTLMKILSGAYVPDEGDILLDGHVMEHVTPLSALKAGISVIYQELNNVDEITVAENIFLGKLPKKHGLVDYRTLEKNAKALLDEIGLEVSPFTPLGKLSIAEKQLVEIAKALSKDMKVLVMDEPTAALNNQETERMFSLVRNLQERGIGMIYISHRMEEIFEISDKVMVMRDGRSIATLETKETDPQSLISLMVGREIADMYPERESYTRETSFTVENLSTEKLKDISFSIGKGEILGLFGLMGSGRTDIAKAIFGAEKRKSGRIVLEGKEISPTSPEKAKKEGIAYIPADRKKDGLMLIHPVRTNMTNSVLGKILTHGLIDRKKEKDLVDGWVDSLSIRTTSIETMINTLSGGNQQKVVLGKWLSIEPKLLIMNEPTRGIDVLSKSEIYLLMDKLTREGVSILMISSDLPEVMGMSDRIVVVKDGRVTGTLQKKDHTEDRILSLAIGIEEER